MHGELGVSWAMGRRGENCKYRKPAFEPIRYLHYRRFCHINTDGDEGYYGDQDGSLDDARTSWMVDCSSNEPKDGFGGGLEGGGRDTDRSAGFSVGSQLSPGSSSEPSDRAHEWQSAEWRSGE